MTWKPCQAMPAPGDTIRWKEPVWAAPNKKRGKPDNIGEQLVTAEVVAVGEFIELKVQSVEALMMEEGMEFDPSKMKEGDAIRRKISTLERGECERLKP
jgi:hypothetical protein